VIPRGASSPDGATAGGHLLTPREAEVLPLLQQGRSNAQIALALQVGVETVRTHARNIYRKLGVTSRRELAAPPALIGQPLSEPATHSPSRSHGTLRARPRRGHWM
jgi:DNA-binding CsgD family transcriptional regulator